LRLYAGKPENPIQFTNSGLVVLGCNIHDQMQGYIYVSSTPFSAISDENGQVSIDYSGKIQQVRLWHEKYNIDERLHLILSANEFEQSKNTDGSYTLTLKLERKLSSPSSNQETSNTFSNSFRRGLD
ncbi:MAG: hypothetical protein P1U57_08175, partial [Oleibacter sp.]|nr:hypothetical protein [Thalassolituus sp.]